jgi:hypothetical protein
MTRTRLSLISTTAVASLLGAAVPAFAQAPAPAPMYAPAPAPMMAPAPAPEPMPVMPAAPVVVPKASDDMTGSVGFGVGVGSGTGTTSLVTTDNTVAIKYWMSDALAIVPRLTFTMAKSKNPPADASELAWRFNPEVLASFVLLKGASTRLAAGVGLGIYLSKNIISTADTTFGVNIPIELGVEHFFTRWFSMGIAMHDEFVSYRKTGDQYNFGLSVNTLSYMGSLFIYTD